MSVDKKDLIALRPGKSEDRNFILACWLRGLYYGNSWFGEVPKDIFMEKYHSILERVLSSPNVTVTVACLKEDSDVILGYAVHRLVNTHKILDWIFVKSAWRHIGIGKSLVPENLYAVTHLTKIGKIVKPSNVIFNPFI